MEFILIVIKSVKWVIVSVLLICFGYFCSDVLEKWGKKDTNIMQNYKRNESFTSPTITFCFNPPLKKTVREKYDLDPHIFKSFVTTENVNHSNIGKK